MNTTLTLGETATFKLQQALLVYEAGNSYNSTTRTAVSVHPVVNGIITAGTPITHAAVESLAAALGRNLAACWLPPNLVSLGFGKMAWFCPASRRRLWFKADGRFNGGADTTNPKADIHDPQTLNGKFAQYPPLLFIATGRRLQVFALVDNERPQAHTRLYRAPYWNLWEDGAMCAGSRAMPDLPTPANIPAYEAAFFDSAFTHTNIKKICLHPKGAFGLWSELVAKAKQSRKHLPDTRYWIANLVRLKFTVNSAITNQENE